MRINKRWPKSYKGTKSKGFSWHISYIFPWIVVQNTHLVPKLQLKLSLFVEAKYAVFLLAHIPWSFDQIQVVGLNSVVTISLSFADDREWHNFIGICQVMFFVTYLPRYGEFYHFAFQHHVNWLIVHCPKRYKFHHLNNLKEFK